jgi:diketogulonate reductase-like aldo/keto reductase
LPAIGQGTGGNDACGDDHRIRILRQGMDLGMTLLDTAEAYRGGHSEEIVGRALQGRRPEAFICTKVGPSNSHPAALPSALEGSLRRLRTDYVDLYQLHWLNPEVPLEATMEALVRLKEAGKVLNLGVCNLTFREFTKAQAAAGGSLLAHQVEYSLSERGPEKDWLPHAGAMNCLTLAHTPLLRGRKGAATLEALAEKYGRSPSQIVLNWLVQHPSVVAIPKTLDMDHVRENAGASDFTLALEDGILLGRAFQPETLSLLPRDIFIKPSSQEPVYTTLEEALANPAGLVPSPRDLAAYIQENGLLKPIRVAKGDQPAYLLLQGRVRFWAWVIAYGPDCPIPALLDD